MFRTNLDGPARRAPSAALYWKENVGNSSDSLTVQASGSHCAWSSATGQTFDDLGFVAPGTGCYGYTERAVAPLLRGGFNFGDGTPYNGIDQYKDTSPADRNTEHKSIFGQVEYEVTADVTAIFEGRYNDETVEAVGPQFLDPLASGGPGQLEPLRLLLPALHRRLHVRPGAHQRATGRDPGTQPTARRPVLQPGGLRELVRRWSPDGTSTSVRHPAAERLGAAHRSARPPDPPDSPTPGRN